MSLDDYEDMKERELLEALRPVKRLAAPLERATRAGHLALISEAAAELRSAPSPEAPPVPVQTPQWRRFARRSWAFTLKLSAAAMAASLSLMGLAYADVDLPGSAAEDAVEAVLGVDLPNQAPVVPDSPESGKSVSDDVRSVIEGTEEKGCELGQAVSEAASANSQGKAPEKDPCSSDEETTEAGVTSEDAGDDDGGRGNSEAGAENAGTHDDGGQAQADESSSTGQEHQSDDAPLGGENAGANNDKGQGTAEEKSSSGQETGETHSEQGKSHQPADPGKP